MKGARFTLTVSSFTVSAPPPSPVIALTSCSCATWLACTHAWAKVSLATMLATCVRVKLWTPLAIGPASARSPSAARGAPCLSSASAASTVSA